MIGMQEAPATDPTPMIEQGSVSPMVTRLASPRRGESRGEGRSRLGPGGQV